MLLGGKGRTKHTTGSCSAVRTWVDVRADPGSSSWLEVLVLSSQQEKHPLSRLASAPPFAWLGKHMCQAKVFGNQTNAWLIYCCINRDQVLGVSEHSLESVIAFASLSFSSHPGVFSPALPEVTQWERPVGSQ